MDLPRNTETARHSSGNVNLRPRSRDRCPSRVSSWQPGQNYYRCVCHSVGFDVDVATSARHAPQHKSHRAVELETTVAHPRRDESTYTDIFCRRTAAIDG